MKIMKLLATTALVVATSVSLVGCGGDGVKPLWKADFSKENNEVFTGYGSITKNVADKSVTLAPNQDENFAGFTYFGETDKNYDWKKGGMTVQVDISIDDEDLTNGNYAVWSLSLNETDGAYITESPVFFIGTESGIKFLYKNTGVDSDYALLAQDTTAVSIADGDYTIKFDYDVNKAGEVVLTVSLYDDDGKRVYKSANNPINVIDHTGYTPGSMLKEENVGGLRSLWLVRTTVPVEVEGLKITK